MLRNRDVLPNRDLNTVTPTVAPPVAINNYDATGITVGPFLYKPAVEILGGYDSNPGRRAGGAGSPVVIVAPELSVRSQFARHQLNADIRAAYTEDTAQRALSHPTVDAKVNGRYDLTDTTALSAEGRFVNDALVTPGFIQQPRVTTYGTTAGVTQKLGAAEVAVKGSFDRIMFSNATLANNQVLNTQDRNYTQPGAQVRVSYALTPHFTPFVDVGFDRRSHDMLVDFNGVRRNSNGIVGRGGVVVNLGSVSGDASVGYLTRRFDAPGMQNIAAG